MTADGYLTFAVTVKVGRTGGCRSWGCAPTMSVLLMQVPLPAVPKAADGDALLEPAEGPPLSVSSALLSLESEVLDTAVQLAKQQAAEAATSETGDQDDAEAETNKLLLIPLYCTSQSEASLLLSALYSRSRLHKLLDSLPADWVLELAAVAHRLACSDILSGADEALVRKCSSSWLAPSTALDVLRLAESSGLPSLQARVAQYIADHVKELKLGSKASGDSLLMVLQRLQLK